MLVLKCCYVFAKKEKNFSIPSGEAAPHGNFAITPYAMFKVALAVTSKHYDSSDAAYMHFPMTVQL